MMSVIMRSISFQEILKLLVVTIHPADVAYQYSVVGAFRRSQVLYAVLASRFLHVTWRRLAQCLHLTDRRMCDAL